MKDRENVSEASETNRVIVFSEHGVAEMRPSDDHQEREDQNYPFDHCNR